MILPPTHYKVPIVREGLKPVKALAGSDVATMSFEILEQLYKHPLTDVGIDLFLKDWAKVPGK